MIYLVGSHAACEAWRSARPGLSPDAVVCVLPGASHGHMLAEDDEVIDAGDATPEQMAALAPCLPALRPVIADPPPGILLSDVRRLRVEPGDALLVTVPAELADPETIACIRAAFAESLPDARVFVVCDGIDVAVVTPPHPGPAPDGLGHRERTPRDPVIVEG